MILQEKVFAATAVGAVVIGFALQDTLGNLFAGLAIQIEKPFRVGQWVTMRIPTVWSAKSPGAPSRFAPRAATSSSCRTANCRERHIINYSEPTPDTRIEVEVGVSYDSAAEPW